MRTGTEAGTTPRRRWRLLAGVAAVGLATAGLVAASPQAQAQGGPSLCSGTAQGFTIVGNVAVPAGASCELIDVTVTGNLIVRADALLSITDTTVGGNLRVNSGGFASAVESTVVGTTRLQDAFGVSAEFSELAGGVVARDAGFYFSDGTAHGARVRSEDGHVTIFSSRIDGNLVSIGDVLADVDDSVVTGNFNVQDALLGSVVCESEIDGQATVRDSGDLVQFGETGPVADCAFNVFASGVALRDNDAEMHIGGNVIRNNLACTDNTAAPTGADNRIRGNQVGQCADLAPAVAAFSTPELAAADRSAEVQAQIEEKLAAAEAAAAAAGPAVLRPEGPPRTRR